MFMYELFLTKKEDDMTVGTKEFQEVMKVFEMTAKKIIRTGAQGFEKAPEDDWHNQQYYNDGRANEAFKIFLAGYSAGRCEYINS